MRPFKDTPTVEFTTTQTLDVTDMPPVMEEVKPVYQQWGFWALLVASIVLSFMSGVLVKTGGHLFV